MIYEVTKIIMTAKFSLFLIITGLFFLVTNVRAGSDSQVINFTATFYGGSCEITAPAELPYNNGVPIPDDTIGGEKQYQSFLLTLTNCEGYFVTPRISVTGNTIIASGISLFADPSSTTKGYGIRLATEGNSRFEANSNTASNNIINAKSLPTGGSDNTNTLNGSLEFNAYLSCGACNQGPDLRGGELKSTVTFKFLYD